MKAAGLLVNQAALLVLKTAVGRLDIEASCLATSERLHLQLAALHTSIWAVQLLAQPADDITHKLQQVSFGVLACLKPRHLCSSKASILQPAGCQAGQCTSPSQGT